MAKIKKRKNVKKTTSTVSKTAPKKTTKRTKIGFQKSRIQWQGQNENHN